jgi:rhamnose transport system substrate-binding protein
VPATLMKKYIEAGQAQDIWWNVTDLGYLTYHVAQLVAQCKINGNPGETFTAGRLGDYTVGDQGEIVLGPAKIVTPANLSEFKF